MKRLPVFTPYLLGLILPWPGLSVSAQDSRSASLYEITTEVGMPNLEEALRYTITHQNRCLTQNELHHLFPILDHPALAGCHLGAAVSRPDAVSFPLVCAGHHGTTGTARWRSREHRVTGTLEVKLGGKNMTFYQRVTAIPLGVCK